MELSWLHLTNSPYWTVHPVYTRGFHAHHLWIINPIDAPETDGIDPDSTSDVLIHDS
jgi:polygalacturonase